MRLFENRINRVAGPWRMARRPHRPAGMVPAHPCVTYSVAIYASGALRRWSGQTASLQIGRPPVLIYEQAELGGTQSGTDTAPIPAGDAGVRGEWLVANNAS